MSKHTKETLNFTGAGYYGAMSSEDGFGGFNYLSDMEYMNASYWQNVVTNWCDTGYQNVTNSSKNAVGCAYDYKVGTMETANLHETFSLTSMIAASAWNTNAVLVASSYTYSHGTLTLKASDTFTISQTATIINFVKLGHPGDFKNIAAVTFQLLNTGLYGNTCTSGTYTSGYQFCFDEVKVNWNGKIPAGHGNHRLPPGLGSHHHMAIHPWAHVVHDTAHADASIGDHNVALHNGDTAYHSQLLSLSEHDWGGLTAQFHLPTVEHFGS